jgi:hypothetical protein
VLHVQLVTAVAPTSGSKLLAGHVVQAAVPFVSLYLPGAQATHGPPSGPVYPTLHGQSLVPGTESVFAGHATHSDEFRQFLYFPASQASHGPPSGPVKPGAQTQIVSPGIEVEPYGHPWHAVTDVAALML